MLLQRVARPFGRPTPQVTSPDLRLTEIDVSSVDDVMRWSSEWIELLGRLDRTSFFNGPEWAASWWETVGEQAPTTLALWHDPQDRLVAVAHLSRQREPLTARFSLGLPVATMMGAGAGAADHLRFPALDRHHDMTWEWFDRRRGRRLGLVRHLDVRSGTPPLPVGATRVGTSGCPTMALPAEIKSSFAKKIRTYSRRLDREGIVIESHAPGAFEDHVLARFDDLQQRRRDDQGRTSTLEDRHHRLMTSLAARSSPGRGLVAVTATRDEQMVGVLLGFATAERFEFYQIGWDPSIANLSVGTVLINQAIEDAEARGAIEFDFLRGDEQYKHRFGAVAVQDEHWQLDAAPIGWVLAARDEVKSRVKKMRDDD